MTLPVTSVHTGVYTFTHLLSSLKWGHHATGWDDSLSEVMIGVTLRFLDSVTNVGRREDSHDFDCSSLTLFGHGLLTLIPSEVKVYWWDSALSRSRQNIFNTTCHPFAGFSWERHATRRFSGPIPRMVSLGSRAASCALRKKRRKLEDIRQLICKFSANQIIERR